MELGERFEVEENWGDYADMMPFFALKYMLFKEEFEGIAQLVERERKLIYTFRKVLYNEVKENQDYKFYQEVNEVYKKYAMLCEEHSRRTNKIRKYDALLYEYLQQKSADMSSIQKIEGVVEIKKCYQFISEVWGNEKWMENIFCFIHAGADKRSRAISPKIVEFLNDLFKYIRRAIPVNNKTSRLKRLPLEKHEAHMCSKLHDVLIVFFEYFDRMKRVDILEQILPYFVIYADDYNREQMEIMILVHHKPNPKIYVLKNLEHFLGKSLTTEV